MQRIKDNQVFCKRTNKLIMCVKIICMHMWCLKRINLLNIKKNKIKEKHDLNMMWIKYYIFFCYIYDIYQIQSYNNRRKQNTGQIDKEKIN